jgi:hypothetical protein
MSDKDLEVYPMNELSKLEGEDFLAFVAKCPPQIRLHLCEAWLSGDL